MPLLWTLWTACTSATPSGQGSTPAYRQAAEAPIQVIVNAHGHNYGLDATPQDDDWWDLKAERFQDDLDAVLHLAELVEGHDGLLSMQLSGEFSRDAVHLTPASLDGLQAALERGHSFGAHFHDQALADQEEWVSLKGGGVTPSELTRIWRDHVEAVEAMAGRTVLRVDAAVGTSEEGVEAALVDRYATRLSSAGDPFSYLPWAHAIWSPFRAAEGLALTEDGDGPRVRIGIYPQIGREEPVGIHVLPTTVVQLQRHFLQVLAQWQWDQLDAAPPRVWTFGLMTHPAQESLSLAELEVFLDWLETSFGDRVGPAGGPVYELVSDEDVLERFRSWERRWPGESSFDFDFEAWLDGGCPVYPYPLEGVALALRDAEVDHAMALRDGVEGWRLSHRTISRNESNASGFGAATVGELGARVWLLQSTDGRSRVLDLAGRLPDALVSVDPHTGEMSSADAATVPVGPVPTLLLEDTAPLEELLAALACE